MSAARGLMLGVGGLAFLDALVAGKGASATNGAVGLLAGGLRRWMDPTVPLIPDLRAPQLASAAAPVGKAPTGGAGGFVNNVVPITSAAGGGSPAKVQ